MARLRVLAENPPPPRGYVENQLQELRDYLTRLKDELEFLLTHLGTDNLDSVLREYVGKIDALEADKQDALTFDAAPTAGSANPVTSGGIFDAAAQYGTGIDMSGGDIAITRKTATAGGANWVAVWARSGGGSKYFFGVWHAQFFTTLASAGGNIPTVASATTGKLTLTIPSGWGNIAVQTVGVPVASIEAVTP